MKLIILKIVKNIVYQLLTIFLIIGGIAFASFSWPTNSPLGETTGGKIMTFINNIIKGCEKEGEYIKKYEADGTPICSKPEGNAIVNAVCGVSNGLPVLTAPTTNLCNEGIPTIVITGIANFTRSCKGSGGGSDVNCSAPKQYAITFNGNGGTGHTPTTKYVTYNATIGTLPSNPTRTGYTFNGWFTATSGGTKITTSTIITGTITFYAHWILNTYTVSGGFGANANGANINVCGINTIADSIGNFTTTRNYESVCNTITASKSGYNCNTITNGPAYLVTNITNISGNCILELPDCQEGFLRFPNNPTFCYDTRNCSSWSGYTCMNSSGTPKCPIGYHIVIGKNYCTIN